MYTAIVLFLLISCSDDNSEDEHQPLTPIADTATKTDTATAAETDTDVDTLQTCYRFDKDIEHHWMKMTRIGDTAYGELHYNWEGKDGANGTFHGNFHGDTLWLIFNSLMEGHHVDIEKAYLLKGEKLLEGQGMQESNEANTYYYFKHKKMIEFSDKEYLAKGPCM